MSIGNQTRPPVGNLDDVALVGDVQVGEMLLHDGAGPLGLLVAVREGEDRRARAGDVHRQRAAREHLLPQLVEARDEALAVRFRDGIPHGTPHKADVAGIQAGHQAAHIAPLGDGGVHVHLLGQDAARLLRGHDQFGVDDGAIEIARYRQLDHVQRLVPADEDDAAHHGGRRIVGVITAAGEVLALHRAHDHILLRQRASEQLVHAEGRRRAGRGTGADAGAGIDLLLDDDIDLRLVPGHFQELAHHRGDHVQFDILRQGNAGFILDGEPVSFRDAHFQDVAHFVQGEAHDVEAAPEIGDGRRCEHSNRLHKQPIFVKFGEDTTTSRGDLCKYNKNI